MRYADHDVCPTTDLFRNECGHCQPKAPTEPGMYDGIPDTVYHADRRSLSSSGARKLLPPSCPAMFRWEQDHERSASDVFDIGHAAHALVLGFGAPLAEIPFDEWRTKEAKQAVADAREAGATPLKPKDFAAVHGMADALRSHPLAAALFADGVPERSGYWRDKQTGVMLRFRPDWLPNLGSGRLIVTDYKTSTTANPEAFRKSANDFGYHQQDAWYRDGAIACDLGEDPAFLFVIQAKVAPYLVSVVELAPEAVALGRRLNRRAIDIYAECTETGIWPGFGEDIHHIDLPAWAYKQEEVA